MVQQTLWKLSVSCSDDAPIIWRRTRYLIDNTLCKQRTHDDLLLRRRIGRCLCRISIGEERAFSDGDDVNEVGLREDTGIEYVREEPIEKGTEESREHV